MSMQAPQKKKGLASWSTRDLLVTAVIGIVFGLVIAGAMNLSIFLMAAMMPLAGLCSGRRNGTVHHTQTGRCGHI